MTRYSFESLSSQDFEELVRDLLQAEWNVALEAFKAGRDSGIDLRCAQADGDSTIIQCKHFAISGYGKLHSHLRVSELPKIQRLAPGRYVLVTSVGLTPGNKDEILQALRPFVKSTADIIGAHDIEGLLSRHPQIERANFKLWFTSTEVLERVLHNAERCQTDFEVARIRKKIPLFVQNDAYPRAAALLEKTRIVVISGVPGIGKTTLAEMLLYAHLEQGYEPVVIQSDISQGKKFFKADAKRIYYYDDFLGQAFLGDRAEYLGRNEDAALVDFMEMVRQSAHGRFILTTREHILSSALQISERLAQSAMLTHRCVLELRDYTLGQKARILYNHLYFSDLPQPYKDAVLEDRFFLTIIKHDHFNPRLIEWLSSQTRLKNVTAGRYRDHISSLLRSPHSIWTHAFHNQISFAARHLLLALYTLGDWTETRDIEPAFIALHRHYATKYNRPIAAGDFRKALQEVDGAFVSYSRDRASFLNPSIREFVASTISDHRETAEDLIDSAIRFEQLAALWKLSTARADSELARFLSESLEPFLRSLPGVMFGPAFRWEKMRDGTMRGYPIDHSLEVRINLLVDLADSRRSAPIAALAVKAVEHLMLSWDAHTPDFPAVIQSLKAIASHTWFREHGGREQYRRLLDGLLENLRFARADDWRQILPFPAKAFEWAEADESRLSRAFKTYCTSGVDQERDECSTLDELSDLKDSLEELANTYGADLAQTVKAIEVDMAEREQPPDERYDPGDIAGRVQSGSQKYVSDEDIAQMFSTLKERN